MNKTLVFLSTIITYLVLGLILFSTLYRFQQESSGLSLILTLDLLSPYCFICLSQDFISIQVIFSYVTLNNPNPFYHKVLFPLNLTSQWSLFSSSIQLTLCALCLNHSKSLCYLALPSYDLLGSLYQQLLLANDFTIFFTYE